MKNLYLFLFALLIVHSSFATIGPITGLNKVCVGTTTSLSDTTVGGVWSCASIYATVNPASGIVTGTAAGSTIITYTTGAGSVTTTVTVIPPPSTISGIHTLCTGAGGNFYCSPIGGTWSSNNTNIGLVSTTDFPMSATSSSTFMGISAGTAIVSYAMTPTCYATLALPINQSPSQISGNLNVCVGYTTALSDSTPGGRWDQAYSYATVGSGTGIVTGISTGTATIYYSIANGCSKAVYVSVVNPAASITGGTSVCLGSSATLHYVASGGTWSSSTPAIATIDSVTGFVTGLTVGSTIITYNISSCSSPIITPFTVTTSVPPITGSPNVCYGKTATLNNSIGGGIWSSSNPSIATIGSTTGIATGVASGAATITYNAGACGITTMNVTTTLPIPSISGGYNMCASGTTTYIDAMPGGVWSSSNTSIATIGSLSGIISGISTGDVNITYTLPTGCFTNTPLRVYPPPSVLTGCNNLGIGDTLLFNNLLYSTWSSSNPLIAQVNSVGKVTGLSVGSTVITMYSPYLGCVEGYKNITVTATALIKPITGHNLICPNTPSPLSDAVSGGIWSCSPLSLATINSLGAVTGLTFGEGAVTYTTSGGASCTLDLYVNATPLPISGPSAECVGDIIALSSSTPGNIWMSVPMSGFDPDNECNAGPFTYYAWGWGPRPVIICDYIADGITYTSSDSTVALPVDYAGHIKGVSTGIATIIATEYYTHCSVTKPITVSSSSIPPITGNSVTCIGSITTLSNVITGGSWSSSNNSIATVGSGTGIITGVAAGTTNITYSNGGVCDNAIATVTVSPTPSVITGNTGVLCIGMSKQLSDGIVGGTWSSSNSSIVSVNAITGLISGLTAGSAVITYTLGPCNSFVTTTVNVNSSFLSSGVTNICAGTNSTLINTTGPGTWTSSNTNIAIVGSATGIVTGVSGGIALITYLSGTCSISTTTMTIFPASPITGPSTICVGTPAIMSSIDPGGTWSLSNYSVGNIDASGNMTAANTGFTNVIYTLPTGCSVTKSVSSNNITLSSITGGGSYCSGGSGVPIGISAMSSGISYQLYNGTTAIGSPLTTTSGTYSFGLQTLAGTYYILASNGTCSRIMTGTATVSISTSVAPITGSSIVCMGGIQTPISDAAFGGTWSSNNTNVAVVGTGSGYVLVGGVSPGTAIIRYGTACGIALFPVNVYAPPPAISGPSTMCQWATTTLSIATTGGTWSSANTTRVTVDPVSGVVTGISQSYGSIMYTAATGCFSEINIFVYQTPAISGPSVLCSGILTPLSSDVAGGTWTSSSTSIATVSTYGYVSGVSAGVSVISYTNSYGGCVNTHPITITTSCSGSPTTGVISASTTSLCAGMPVALNLIGSSSGCGISYQWQSSTDSIIWNDIPGAVSNSYTGYPSTNYYYRCAVTCASSTITSYTSPLHVSIRYAIASNSIISTTDTACHNAHFYLSVCNPSSLLNVTTYFGDGTFSNTSISGYSVDVYHNYSLPGTYTIKQILYLGTVAQDSVIFTYNHNYCLTLPIKFYQDFNNNCVFDAGDNYNMQPVMVAIDSNGVTIDSIIVTSGLYKNVSGPIGTVYSFRVLSVSGSRIVACPLSAIIYDTITTAYTYPAKYFGLHCGTSTAYDLTENVTLTCSTTRANGMIYISNSYCTPVNPVVIMNMSPKYHYGTATPLPTSIVGNTVTWNMPTLSSAGTSSEAISITMYPSVTLVPGDTVHSDYLVTPLSGDVNTANNYVALVNNITISYDPNYIQVSPTGNILPCQQLRYTVNFENTGNDIARNIHVLDTLPSGVDPGTLNVVMASAIMDVTVMKDGVFNIARFDFPGINLLDSSHHNQSHGMFIFDIKARNPLPDGTTINNKAGIYFDDNTVVMTNTVNNVIGMDTISGPNNVCVGSAITLSDATNGGTWISSNTAISISSGTITGSTTGITNIGYTISNGCASRTMYKLVTVNSVVVPSVNVVRSPSGTFCSGTPVTFYATPTNGGTAPSFQWKVNGVNTGVTSSTFTYTPANLDTVTSILTSNATCRLHDTSSQRMGINVSSIVTPSVSISRTPAGTLCIGMPVSFIATATNGGSLPSYQWKINGSFTGTSGNTYTYYPTNNDVITSILTSNASCALPDTSSHSIILSVNSIVSPSVNILRSPAGILCTGQPVTLTAIPVNGGTSPAYEWILNGINTGASGSTFTYTPVNNDLVTSELTSNANCVSPDTSSHNVTIHVTPSVLPSVSIAISPASSVCAGTPVAFSAVTINGGALPSYQWSVNGINTGSTGSIFSYIPVNNDIITVVLTSNALCASPDTSLSSQTITVNPSLIPLVAINVIPGSYIGIGQSLTLQAVVTNGGVSPSYKWFVNGNVVPGAISSTFVSNTFADNDSVSCVVTASGQCGYSSFNAVIIHVSDVGIMQVSQSSNDIKLIPNPNTGVFYIKGSWGFPQDQTISVEITDMLGQIVYRNMVTNNNGVINEQIQIGNSFSNGMYMLNLRSATKHKVFHFVVEH